MTNGAEALRSLLAKQGQLAYGETVWSWPSSLRSSFCEGLTRVNRRAEREFRDRDGGKKELVSGESAA